MKRFSLLLLIIMFSLSVKAQEKLPQDINKKHELKLNAFSLIVFSSLDISYERLLNKDSSFGVGVFYNFNSIDNDLYYPKKFSITPYYRWFFTDSRFARGFFVEGFGMLNTYEDQEYFWGSPKQTEQETSFALGISVGGKFIIKSGFTAEVYAGVGRNLFNNNSVDDSIDLGNDIITRGGISLGYRF
ncbi:DUF3575 domain-containing protein [Polaribacter litorisediminis]|uniref:DUF3575 domain-containing protein n=1 Tax=Polaribacter litorisediminis TaxID=1908341 RepID=UPI001CBE7A52|nr:DUF3575 domain-containing protein [Polaribacter litorisediminis]UAM97346.1 DUF3575 domain-containing protein [Polaribacter litorisediminis]